MNDNLIQIINETPNDMELGEKLRNSLNNTFIIYIKDEFKIIDMNRDYPNNSILGETIRKLLII